jgi:hypothetical protein
MNDGFVNINMKVAQRLMNTKTARKSIDVNVLLYRIKAIIRLGHCNL